MSRWRIGTVALYSHDGRLREVVFRPGLNIVAGPSHTGKSAIIEVIDYCMGAAECHLPGVVREASAWVGMTWLRGNEGCGIARRVPRAREATAEEMYWRRGPADPFLLPRSLNDMETVGQRHAVLRQIEQLFGIGNASTEPRRSDTPGRRISVRHVMPYLLQDDDVIISKTNLLRGTNDERRRDIIDSLPYFLRVSDEQTAAIEGEYRRLSQRLRNQERQLAEDNRLVGREMDRARRILEEAASVGLVGAPLPSSQAEALRLLGEAARWRPGTPADAPASGELEEAYQEERQLREEIAVIRRQIQAGEEAVSAAAGFGDVARAQRRKLQHVEIYPDDGDSEHCPVCGSKVEDEAGTLHVLKDAARQLKRELAVLERDRPKLDHFLERARDRLQEKREMLKAVRTKISERVAAADASVVHDDLEHSRSRIVGKISLYLEGVGQEEQRPGDSLASLRDQVSRLEAMVDEESKRERLEIEQQGLALEATQLLKRLPFDPDYADATAYLIARNLSCGIVTPRRRIAMRDMGSDENYLSMHVAFLLALHRFFHQKDAPVPGVVIFDQISRPYYPAEDTPDEVVMPSGSDAAALKKYFDVLQAESIADDLQVIVLEHAYLQSDPGFVASTVERWTLSERLVPASWVRD